MWSGCCEKPGPEGRRGAEAEAKATAAAGALFLSFFSFFVFFFLYHFVISSRCLFFFL